jgi:hypothetical protein
MHYGISVQQLAVICALSNGATINGAPDQAPVHRNTHPSGIPNQPVRAAPVRTTSVAALTRTRPPQRLKPNIFLFQE